MAELRVGAFKRDPLRTSGTYKLRSGREGDLYVLNRETKGILKVSLHPGLWKVEQTSGSPGRQTFEPTTAMFAGHEPVVRIVTSLGGLTPRQELDNSVNWVEWPGDAEVIEFRVYIAPSARVALTVGPGLALCGRFRIGHSESTAFVIAHPHETSPVPAMQIAPAEREKSFTRAVEDIERGAAKASWWSVGEAGVLIVDDVHLHRAATSDAIVDGTD